MTHLQSISDVSLLGEFLSILEVVVLIALVIQSIRVAGLLFGGGGKGSLALETGVDSQIAHEGPNLMRRVAEAEKEAETVEKIDVEDLRMLHQLRPFLEKILNLPGTIQSEQIKTLAKTRGNALRKVSGKLLINCRRRQDKFRTMRQRTELTFNRLRNERTRHANAVFRGGSSRLRTKENKVDSRINATINRAKREVEIVNTANAYDQQLNAAATFVAQQVNGLITDWSNGRLERGKVKALMDRVHIVEWTVVKLDGVLKSVEKNTPRLTKSIGSETKMLRQASTNSRKEQKALQAGQSKMLDNKL